jgi:hypothetical protein
LAFVEKDISRESKGRESVIKLKANDDFDFYKIAFEELKKINCKRRIIPFPLVFNRLGTMFHFDKKNSVMLLKKIQTEGYVEIIPFKGIRIARKEIV